MKFNNFCYILLLVSIFSCTNKINNNSVVQTKAGLTELYIDLNQTVPLDSIFDDIIYIKLETTGNNLISDISQILFTDDRIIIVDNEKSQTITVYDMNGKFLNQIGTIGQGPEEFSSINHVALSNDKAHLVINDYGSKRFKFYKLSGEYVKYTNIPYWCYHFEFINDNLIVEQKFSGFRDFMEEKPRLLITDLTGKTYFKGFRSYYNENYTMMTWQPLRKFDDVIIYSPEFTDTLFAVFKDRVTPLYYLNYKGVEPLQIDENITDESLKEYNLKYSLFNGDIIELKDFVVLNIFHDRHDKYIVYNKLNKKIKCSSRHLENPFFFLSYIKPITRYKDNYVVSVYQAYQILAEKEKMYSLYDNMSDKHKSLMDKLFTELDEDDNPVLILFHMRS